MKRTVWFLSLLGFTLALPSSKVISQPVEPIHVPLKTIDVTVDSIGSRIIGGQEVVPHSVPYQVAVVLDNSYLCGGSLISTTTVLTAAHCTISASIVELRLGAHYHSGFDPTVVRLTSTSFIIHENYSSAAMINDISLVLLPSEVTLNSAIQVVSLAPATSLDYEGSEAYFTGWGLTDDWALSPVLRGVNVSVISNTECSSSFSNIRDSIVCTSGVSSSGNAVGACSSDSGGPLVVDGVQVGIVTFGNLNCTGRYPTGFTRVSSFSNWIQENSEV